MGKLYFKTNHPRDASTGHNCSYPNVKSQTLAVKSHHPFSQPNAESLNYMKDYQTTIVIHLPKHHLSHQTLPKQMTHQTHPTAASTKS